MCVYSATTQVHEVTVRECGHWDLWGLHHLPTWLIEWWGPAGLASSLAYYRLFLVVTLFPNFNLEAWEFMWKRKSKIMQTAQSQHFLNGNGWGWVWKGKIRGRWKKKNWWLDLLEGGKLSCQKTLLPHPPRPSQSPFSQEKVVFL